MPLKNLRHEQTRLDRVSKMPKGLGDRVIALMKDDNYLSLRTDIAMVDARIEELYSRLHGNVDEIFYAKLAQLDLERQAYENAREPEIAKKRLERMSILIHAAREDYRVHHEIEAMRSQRIKLVEAEAKVLVATAQIVTPEEMFAILLKIAQIVKRVMGSVCTYKNPDFRHQVVLAQTTIAHEILELAQSEKVQQFVEENPEHEVIEIPSLKSTLQQQQFADRDLLIEQILDEPPVPPSAFEDPILAIRQAGVILSPEKVAEIQAKQPRRVIKRRTLPKNGLNHKGPSLLLEPLDPSHGS